MDRRLLGGEWQPRPEMAVEQGQLPSPGSRARPCCGNLVRVSSAEVEARAPDPCRVVSTARRSGPCAASAHRSVATWSCHRDLGREPGLGAGQEWPEGLLGLRRRQRWREKLELCCRSPKTPPPHTLGWLPAPKESRFLKQNLQEYLKFFLKLCLQIPLHCSRMCIL